MHFGDADFIHRVVGHFRPSEVRAVSVTGKATKFGPMSGLSGTYCCTCIQTVMLPREVFYAVALRVGIALGTRTFFQPDEYFQSLEPAHHAVFGYGHLTWEWLSPSPIRSFLYPALNVPIYLLLRLTKMDSLFPSLVVRPLILRMSNV